MELQENSHQLLATMFADIQGYTALMQNDEQGAVSLVKAFKETIEREVADHNGRVIQFYGDAIMAVFPSSVDAVSAAQIIQRAFNSAGDVPVRIGINSGDVLYRDKNIFGDSVNIASRIESMGIPGSVLISKEVQNQIRNKKDILTESLGSFEFKNVEDGIEVFALTSPGLTRPLPTQLKGKFKRGFSVPIEKSSEEIKLEQNRKIAKTAIPLLSSAVILSVLAIALNQFWVFFPVIPIMMTLIGRVVSIKLYDDPSGLDKERKEDGRKAKQLKRQAKVDARIAKRDAKRQAKIQKQNPPKREQKRTPIDLPEDDDFTDELELKELHRVEREKWNDEDFV